MSESSTSNRPVQPEARTRWYVTLAIGFGVLVLTALLPWGSDLQARVAMSGIGAMSGVLVLAKPRSFWESDRIQAWRFFMGDRGVVLIYLVVAAGFIAVAWLYSVLMQPGA